MQDFRYYSIPDANMLLGALIKKPSLFQTPQSEAISETDFVNPMHRLAYGSMFNAYQLGHSVFTPIVLENVISGDPSAKKFFDEHGGKEYLQRLYEVGEPGSFVPAFEYTKKMTLLRNLDKSGVDISRFYDWDATDEKVVNHQSAWLNSKDVGEIANEISDHIEIIIGESTSTHLHSRESAHVGDNLSELIASLKEEPDYGTPLAIDLSNTIVRGARLGKFYLRSAPTGGGKSRLAAADTVHFGADKLYDPYTQTWKENGAKEPSLFITTELDIEEVQTMMLSYLTGINEEHILEGKCDAHEEAILMEGIKIIQESPIYIEFIPDFSVKEIENIIRSHYREKGVKYFAFDYIHSSMKFLEEISSITNGMRLREDQILFMLATRLKELANTLGVFIQSSTQLNGDWAEATEVNQNLLRGAKSIADRLDVGMIAMKAREIDKSAIEAFVREGYEEPNYFISFYKMRRGKYAGTKLWCRADLGTSRVRGLFLTDGSDVPLPLDKKTIQVQKRKEQEPKNTGERVSAF